MTSRLKIVTSKQKITASGSEAKCESLNEDNFQNGLSFRRAVVGVPGYASADSRLSLGHDSQPVPPTQCSCSLTSWSIYGYFGKPGEGKLW